MRAAQEMRERHPTVLVMVRTAAMVTQTPSGWILRTSAIGLAYLAAQMSAALYNAYLPIFYGAFIASNTLIGLVMIIDNIASLTIQPYFAGLSDRVDTRLGRRIPFLLVGIPVAALSFVMIPRARSFTLLFAATLLVNTAGAAFNSPGYALMPDITPRPLRSRATGILNMRGGLGAVIAFLVLSPLIRRSRTLPFDIASGILLAALVVILLVIRERQLSHLYLADQAPASDAEVGRLLPAVRMVVLSRDRSLLFLMLGALAWVAAVNGVQNMFTRYGVQHLGLDPAGATSILAFFAIAFIACSVPAGILGDRLGRLKAIRLGAAGTLVTLLAVSFIRDAVLYRLSLIIGGVGWALVITNAYPFFVDRIPAAQTGTFTGLWNATLALAGPVAPPVHRAGGGGVGVGGLFLAGGGVLVGGIAG